jgi:hypothetical protein
MAERSRTFLKAMIVGVVAVFIFFTASAKAATLQSSLSNGYDIASSAENLISPFKSFFDSFHWTTNIDIQPSTSTWPIVNVPPTIQNLFQNLFWEFNNWFYGVTNIKLSGIALSVANGYSWLWGNIIGVFDWLFSWSKTAYTS